MNPMKVPPPEKVFPLNCIVPAYRSPFFPYKLTPIGLKSISGISIASSLTFLTTKTLTIPTRTTTAESSALILTAGKVGIDASTIVIKDFVLTSVIACIHSNGLAPAPITNGKTSPSDRICPPPNSLLPHRSIELYGLYPLGRFDVVIIRHAFLSAWFLENFRSVFAFS